MIEPDERIKIYSAIDTRFEDFVTILSDYLRVPTTAPRFRPHCGLCVSCFQ